LITSLGYTKHEKSTNVIKIASAVGRKGERGRGIAAPSDLALRVLAVPYYENLSAREIC